MGTLLIVISLFVNQAEAIVVKEYGCRRASGGTFFNAIICFFSMLFFIVTDKNGFYLPPKLFAYGIISCLAYAGGFYFMYLALKLGSFANTKLVSSISGIVIIIYGVVFLNEKSNVITWIAVFLIFLSVFLMNYSGKSEKRINIKWLFYALLTVVANCVIGITKREQQLRFDGKCDNEFMIISLFGAFVFLFIYGFISEREKLKTAVKSGMLFGAVAGAFNGASNFLSLVIYNFVPISIVSPVSTGGGLVLSFVVSAVLYKERFTPRQIVSAVIGVIALVLFKIA